MKHQDNTSLKLIHYQVELFLVIVSFVINGLLGHEIKLIVAKIFTI